MSDSYVSYEKWKREIPNKIGEPHIYFLEREGKTNTIKKLVFDKFPSNGNSYLTKISPIKYNNHWIYFGVFVNLFNKEILHNN